MVDVLKKYEWTSELIMGHVLNNLKFAHVAGTTATTPIPVSGLLTTAVIISVTEADGDDADHTAEVSIPSAGNIALSSTDTTGNTLLVVYINTAEKL